MRLTQDQLIIWKLYGNGSVTVWKLEGRPPATTSKVSSGSPSFLSALTSFLFALTFSSASSASPSVVQMAEIPCKPMALKTAVDMQGKTVAVATKTSSGPAFWPYERSYAINFFDMEQQAVIRVIPVTHTFSSMFWVGKEDLLLGQTVNGKPKVEVGMDRVYAVTDMPACILKHTYLHALTHTLMLHSISPLPHIYTHPTGSFSRTVGLCRAFSL